MRSLLLSLAVIVLTALPGASTQLAFWDFSGAATDPLTITSTDPNLFASSLSRNGVTPVTTGGLFFNGTDWPVAAFGAAYYEMTLTPGVGYEIDYTTATIDWVVGSNPTFTTELVTSLDGYATPLASHVDSPGVSSYSDSLASLGIQTDSVTFRIYGYVDSNGGSSGLYAGNLTFNASDPSAVSLIPAAVPEPSTLSLLGASLFALLAVARKRR